MEFGPALVDIGGRRLNAMVRGEGPLMVLEGGGMMPGTMYGPRLVPALAKFATVMTYDRAGLGASDAAGARTAGQMAEDLHALLSALKLQQPAVLIGYSLSALIVQIFAQRHPDQTAGLVLFDPTLADTFDAKALAAPVDPTKMELPPQLQAAAKAELSLMKESCAEVLAIEAGMPKRPAVIVRAGKRMPVPNAKALDALMDQRFSRLAQVLGAPEPILAPNSTHTTIFSTDTEIAFNAIRDVLGRSKA